MRIVIFKDNSIAAVALLEKSVQKWLENSSELLEAQVKENTAVDTGKTRNGWTHQVNNLSHQAIIGNPYKNSVWEEFGTGEYALNSRGRKKGWSYIDDDGNWHFTYGKYPRRPFHNAFEKRKHDIINHAKKLIMEGFK